MERITDLLSRIESLSDDELRELADLIAEVLEGNDPDAVITSDAFALIAAGVEAVEGEGKRREATRAGMAALRQSFVPADRAPILRTSTATALTASGRELRDGTDIVEELRAAVRQSSARPVEGRTLVASVKVGGDALRISDTASAEDTTKILREQRTAIVAAGGFGAPAPIDYSMPSFGESQERPLRDAFPAIVAERGQITFLRNLGLADLAGSASVWDAADDVAALADDGPRKPYLRAPFPADVTVQTEAIVSHVIHGNLAARSFPEHLERVLELANLAHTVLAERELLSTLDGLSVPVTVAAGAGALGATRQVIPTLGLAAAGVRSRMRLSPDAELQVILPATFRTVVKVDIQRQHPGDRALQISDADVDAMFAVHNLTPVYSLDHQVVPAQSANSALVAIEDDLVAYLVVPGSVYFLDGGTLDLGIYRDSALVAANDFGVFSETFEALAVTGLAPVKLTIAGSVPSGVSRAAA